MKKNTYIILLAFIVCAFNGFRIYDLTFNRMDLLNNADPYQLSLAANLDTNWLSLSEEQISDWSKDRLSFEFLKTKDQYSPEKYYYAHIGWAALIRLAWTIFSENPLQLGSFYTPLVLNILLEAVMEFLLVLLVFNFTNSKLVTFFSLLVTLLSSSRYEAFLLREGTYSVPALFIVIIIYLFLALKTKNKEQINWKNKNSSKNINIFNFIIVSLIAISLIIATVMRPNLVFLAVPIVFGFFYVFQNIKKFIISTVIFFSLFTSMFIPAYVSTLQYGWYWHLVYLGIGYYENPWNIEKIDTYALKIAKENGIKPLFPDGVKNPEDINNYNKFLKGLVISHFKENPYLFLKNAIKNHVVGFVRYSILSFSGFEKITKVLTAFISYVLLISTLIYHRRFDERQKKLLVACYLFGAYIVASICTAYAPAYHYLYPYMPINIILVSFGFYAIKNYFLNDIKEKLNSKRNKKT